MIGRDANPHNVVIIGSGIGGLTAGILLLQIGLSVTIVEKNAQPGGMMRGYRRLGIECPVGVHYMGALDEGQPLRRLWDHLGVSRAIPLERMGTEGIVDRYIFDDFSFDLPVGIDAFEASLRQLVPGEGRQIEAIVAHLRTISQSLMQLDAMAASPTAILSPESFEPMEERLVQMGCSPRLMSVLAVPSTLIGVPLRECPVFYYYMTLASYLMSSWRLACSGAEMADAFVSRFKALGGDLVTGDSAATIPVESGQVAGVVLRSGRVLETAAVVAAIHPKTLLPILPAGTFRPSYTERITQLTDTKGMIGINAAVSADSCKALPHNVYRLRSDADGSVCQGVFHQVRPTGNPKTNLLSLITTSGIEEWLPWAETSPGRRGKDYVAAKEEKARILMDDAERLIGPFGDVKVLDVYTPLTIRDWVGSPGGSPYGVLRSAGQLMKAASLTRTAVKGLYLAGQNRLCPGIMGTTLGSFQMVRQMIGAERYEKEIIRRFL